MNGINSYLSSKYSLLILIILGFIYNVIVHKNNVLLVIMFFIIVYLFNLYNIKEKLENRTFKTDKELKEELIIDLVNKDISHHKNDKFFMDNPKLYKIYKKPTDFYFLKNNKFMEEIIYDLRFIEKYDRGDFFKMMILMDAFLKIYYYIIDDRYDYYYIDILVDVRLELLNVINNFMVDAPMFSKNKKVRLDKHINDNLLKVQAYTFKKLKNISKKYPQFNPKNPKGISKDNIDDNYNIII